MIISSPGQHCIVDLSASGQHCGTVDRYMFVVTRVCLECSTTLSIEWLTDEFDGGVTRIE